MSTDSQYPALKPEVKALWLSALLSKAYNQTTSYLRRQKNGRDSYCCLGVLCDLAPNGNWGNPRNEIVPFSHTSAMPTVGVKNWAGLSGSAASKLAEMNDGGAKFHAIAKWIDENL